MSGESPHRTKLIDLITRTELFRAHDQANRQRGEIRDELADHRCGGIPLITDREENLVLRIILKAKAGEILVSFGVQSVNRFEDRCGRREIARRCIVAPEKAESRNDDEQIPERGQYRRA